MSTYRQNQMNVAKTRLQRTIGTQQKSLNEKSVAIANLQQQMLTQQNQLYEEKISNKRQLNNSLKFCEMNEKIEADKEKALGLGAN